MANPSYRPNLNRNPTKKWAEAQSVDYGGDDWGDDDYDDDEYGQTQHDSASASAGSQRYPNWGQPSGHSAQRSFTNPALSLNTGRTSFDRDDDRRHFSAGGYDPRSQAHPPGPQFLQQGPIDPNTRGQFNPPLQANTQTSISPAHSSVPIGPRNDHADAYDVPRSVPIDRAPQTSQLDQSFVRHDTLGRDAAQSQADRGPATLGTGQSSGLSDIGQTRFPQEIHNPANFNDSLQSQNTSQPLDAKPLPFIRPADIYKRVEEEREKQRRSQESSRPSIDSATGKSTSPSTRSAEPALSNERYSPIPEIGASKNAKPTLNTQSERKTEYGLSPISEKSTRSPIVSSAVESPTTATIVDPHRPHLPSRTASSVYTDRPDPTSASSTTPFVIHHDQDPLTAQNTLSSRQHMHYSPITSVPTGILAEEQARRATEDLPNFDHGSSPNSSAALAGGLPAPKNDLRHKNQDDSFLSSPLRQQTPLTHQSSVHQSFDTGNNSSLSPAISHDDLQKSNISITPDISPITSRTADVDHDKDALPGSFSRASAALPETQLPSFDLAGPAVATGTSQSTTDTTTLPATTFVPDHRRENISPSTRTTNRDQRPLSTEKSAVPPVQHASSPPAPALAPASSAHAQPPAVQVMPSSQEAPVMRDMSHFKPTTSQSELMPPPTSRTASEDWQEWDTQRRQFNAKHGFHDSNTASPAVSSPISRAESPVKGTVRDIAGRLESNSGRSSPVNQSMSNDHALASDKPSNIRTESFRPSLPGGWVSYTSLPSQTENVEPIKPRNPQHPPLISEHNRTESTDSIPTAKAPKQWQSSNTGPMEAAFAAAAAAGNAMMGAFSGPALSRNTKRHSETSSEDENDSEISQPQPPEFSETRDFASSPLREHVKTQSPIVPPPIAVPASINNTTRETRDVTTTEPHRHVDIPAPLRTSRSDGSDLSSPRISIPSVISAQHHHDHERLEDEIVQSLTPKTSRMDDSQLRTMMPYDRSQETNSRSSQQVSSISDEDDVLPLENRSYRDDRPVSFTHEDALVDAKTETPTKTTIRPPIPIVHIPDDTTAVPIHTNTGTRPFLEQRYSWETGPDDHKKAAEPPISDFEQGLSKDRPSTPIRISVPPPSTLSPPTPVVHKVEESREAPRDIGHSLATSYTPPTSATPTTATPVAPIHSAAISGPSGVSSFPQEQTEFKDILAYKDSSQRIRAFDNNRQTYAQHSGLLEQWISSMNTPEHRDVFDGSRTSRVSPTSAANNIRPSPRRDTTTASGSKQMQEDGKRLLAAAGKYSGKAGNVAKGIFAKGKDKLRTASSSDKVPTVNRRPSNSRRRSSNYDIDPPFVPRSQESVLPDKAPQIPAPALDTPTRESWSMLSSMFQERPQQANTELPSKSTGHTVASGSALGSDRLPMPVHSGPRNDHSNIPNPPVSVLASIPGNDNTFIGPQPFPDYGTGTKHEVGRTTHVDTERDGPITTQDHNNLSKTVSANNQPFHHQRVDSLPVPRARRPSSISDVSDISAAADERKDMPPRSVSPTLDNRSSVPRAPITRIEQSSKHDEALQDRRSMEESTLPAYESATGNVIDKRQSKIAPGTQIMPVTNLTTTEAEDSQQSGSRPFSFFGSETLNHALAQQAGLNAQREAAQQSPTEEHIRVDMEKTLQPNITEHPAYKNTGQVGQDPQPENPLPSSRRSPQDFEQYRYRQQQITVPQVPPIPQGLQRGQGEEAYRIPGPYVQEYRSPRSTKPPVGQHPSQDSHDSSEHESRATPRTQNRLSGIAPRTETSEQSSQIEQRPEFERSKSRTFGGMFRTRSKSQSRRQARDTRHGSSQGLDNYPDDGKRRKGLFGLGNRSSSPGDRVNDSQGQFPPAADSGRGRKHSMDMLRPTNGNKPQTDNKKKRSSGFSSLFGKSGTKDRDDYRRDDYRGDDYRRDDDRRGDYRRDDERRGDYRRDEPMRDERRLEPRASFPLSSNPQQDYRNYNQYSSNTQQPTSSVEQHYGPVNTNQSAYSQYTSPIGPMQGPSSMPGTAYQETKGYHAPGDQHVPSGQATAGNWQSVSDRPQIYTDSPANAVTAVPRASNLQQASTDTYVPPVSSSPTVPVTRTNRDISYGQERPYAPPTSEGKPDMADHVKNLHKRSRSPRLGRPPSDEHLHGSLVDQNTFSPIGPQAPQNPAAQLGMFQNKKISPGGGVQRSDEEQEKPWTIGLPDGGEEDSSDGDRHRRRQQHLHNTPGRSDTFTQSDIVSPTTPRQYDQRDSHGGIVSPITAVEPRGYNMDTMTSAPTKNDAFTSSQYQPQHREHVNIVEQQRTIAPAPVPQISVPPTLSSAGQIPDPQPRTHDVTVIKPASTRQSLDLNPQTHSTDGPQTTTANQIVGPKEPGHVVPHSEASTLDQHTSTTPSSAPPPSQVSRTLKRISIERTPENYQTASPVSSRPLTVAEKVMGIQPAARGTMPEHRSTTPIPKSPAPSLGAPPKTTTWPDNMPSTAAISTSNTTPTTVVTTTMRSGSKLSKGSMKTKTYVIDSNAPSRSNSTATANSSRRLIDPDQSTARPNVPTTLGTNTSSTTNTAAAAAAAAAAPKVEPITTNILQTTTGSKRSINGPPVPSQGKSFEAFELPGSRPDGYESEEEIVMSATAYPGQEWMPEYAQGVHWDD